jgi:hypothetical protein
MVRVYDGISLKLSRLIYDDCAKNVFCAHQDIGVEIPECIGKKCTRQRAPTVEMNVKFLSSQTEADQSIAESATLKEDPHEDIRLTCFV